MRRSQKSESLRSQRSRVLALEESLAGRLANDGGLGGLIVVQTCVRCRGVIALGDASRGDATVGVRSKDAADLVHSNVIEVQKVSRSTGASGSLRTNHAELYRIGRRSIYSEPILATVIRGSHIAMPRH